MSITQGQFDALKPGDRFIDDAQCRCTVIAWYDGNLWARIDARGSAHVFSRSTIDAIIPPAPHPVTWVNLDADGCTVAHASRHVADECGYSDRTHVITIYSDGSTTTEAVS